MPTTLSPITASIPSFTVTPTPNSPTFPEDIDIYNSEMPSVITQQRLLTTQINTLIPQLNTLETNVSTLEANTSTVASIAQSIANFQGAWSSITAYTIPASVSLGGVVYMAIQPSTNHTPPNTTYWIPLPGIDDTTPSTTSLFSSSYTKSLIDANTAAIVTLGSSNAKGQFGASPYGTPIALSTTTAAVTFGILAQSNNTSLFSIGSSNTLTFTAAGTYEFLSTVTVKNNAVTSVSDTVTFNVLDASNNVLFTTSTPMQTGAGNNQILSFNSILTVTSGQVPITVHITASATTTSYSIIALNSILSIQGSAITVLNPTFNAVGIESPSDSKIANIVSQNGMGSNQTFTLPLIGGLLARALDIVDLVSAQVIAGIKTFISGIQAPSISYKATPVSITAWSYTGTTTTTIALTVASHTFVVNDFISVNGLTTSTAVSTANTYIIPNGVYQVTAVTATTIQYIITTGSGIALTPTVSGATVVGQTAINGVVGGLGSGGQTWQDVTASRALGTTYTNSTGKPIMVFVTKTNTGNSAWPFYVNSVYIMYVNAYGTNNSTGVIIPNGATYMADTIAGTLLKWVELR